MCGIAGVIDPTLDAPRLRSILSSMVETLSHRGPDSSGLRVQAGMGIGMRRLAVIDLVTGDQPLSDESGRIWVVQNGEVYNFRELRRDLESRGHRFTTSSDTEVLVHGWNQWGEALPDHLNGMFAFAVWDEADRRLFLARDHMGVKPLYWARCQEAFLFGSESKALLASNLIDRRIDRVAWGQYLVFEHVPAPRSIWQGVQKLEAGSWLSFHDSVVSGPRRYWRLGFEPDRSGSYRDRCGELGEALRKAVRMELMSDVDVGVLLSGGVDSSAVALFTAGASTQPSTFTLGFDDPSFDESYWAREVAAHLGATHHQASFAPGDLAGVADEMLPLMDEPSADSSLLATYALCRFAAEHVKVVLGGDGGDELWAGYPTYLAHRLGRLYRRLPSWLRRRLVEPAVARLPTSLDNLSFDFRAKRFITGFDHPPELQHHLWIGGWSPQRIRSAVEPDLARQLSDEVLLDPILRLMPHAREMEPMDRLLYLDSELYLQGVLTKTDRASMACSLEVRVPLLNRHVVEVARRVPFEWKLRGTRSKAILRDTVGPRLPHHVGSRPKKGFNFPVSKMLRGPQRRRLDELVTGPEGFRRGALDTVVDEHLSGRADHRKLLWPLVVLQAWTDGWLSPTSPRRREP